MSATNESENLPNHSTERVNPNGWRVISNPTGRPNPGALVSYITPMAVMLCNYPMEETSASTLRTPLSAAELGRRSL